MTGPRQAEIRYRVDPRDVPPEKAARRLHLTLARFNEFMSSYRDLFHGLEIPHCLVRTDQNPWGALAMFLAERKRLK